MSGHPVSPTGLADSTELFRILRDSSLDTTWRAALPVTFRPLDGGEHGEVSIPPCGIPCRTDDSASYCGLSPSHHATPVSSPQPMAWPQTPSPKASASRGDRGRRPGERPKAAVATAAWWTCPAIARRPPPVSRAFDDRGHQSRHTHEERPVCPVRIACRCWEFSLIIARLRLDLD